METTPPANPEPVADPTAPSTEELGVLEAELAQLEQDLADLEADDRGED